VPQRSAHIPVESNLAGWSCDCLAHHYENAGDRPDRVRRYDSDMTDAQWAIVRDTTPNTPNE
jgi:hypothetical protein